MSDIAESRLTATGRQWWRRTNWLWSVGGVLGFLVLWQIGSDAGIISEQFFSSPTAWARALWDITEDGSLARNLGSTLAVLGIGLGFSLVIAIPVGLLIGCFRRLELVTRPIIAAFQSVPYVAVLPLAIVIFGINGSGKIAIVMFATIFPLIFNAIDGALNIPLSMRQVPRAFCLGQTRTIIRVVVPASLPYVLSGVRIAVGRALVAAIVAEFFMSTNGLGYFVSEQANAFNTDNVFAGLIVMALLGIILVKGVGAFESRFADWKS